VTLAAEAQALLVTGGAGFIGANLVRHLLRHTAAPLVVLDKLSYAGHRESLAELEGEPRFRFVQGDIGDRALVGRLLETHRPRAVLNLAAETHVDRSIDDPSAFLAPAWNGAPACSRRCEHWRGLAEPARSGFRFLHVSTDEVYGSIAAGARADERALLAPSSPYSASKAAADQLMVAWHHTYGLPVLVTHAANNFGPFQHPEKLIPHMLLNALDGKPLPVYGDGLNERDWLYVEDHCEALRLVLEGGRPGERYNVGVGRECSNRALVERLCALLEAERPAARNAALAGRGIGAYRELISSSGLARHDRHALDPGSSRELGWRPRHDEALRATRWYSRTTPGAAVGHDRRRLGSARERA
jgi:dTDP-glucose 4,6-dehydratase